MGSRKNASGRRLLAYSNYADCSVPVCCDPKESLEEMDAAGKVGTNQVTNAILPLQKMVGLFYYENVGKNCRKILQYEGRPNKILLFPDEGVAAGPSKHWVLKTVWWSKRYCKIVEVVAGVKKRETRGRIYNYPTWGVMVIVGQFANDPHPDFCVRLSSQVSREDFRSGYSMCGVLEQGDFNQGVSFLTHYAMIKRRDVV